MNAFVRTLALRKDKKMRGYGVYLRIVELCNESPDGRLTFSYAEIAWDMRERVDFVQSVIENYGLFHIKDGAIMVSAEGDNVGIEKPTTTPSTVITPEQKPTPSVVGVDKPQPPQSPQPKAEETKPWRASDLKLGPRNYAPYKRLKARWNELAPEPGRAVRTELPTSDVYETLEDTLKEFSEGEVAQALAIAAKDASWNWQLEHALRAKNVRMLLSRRAHQEMVEESEKYKGLSPSAIEVVKYAESQTTVVNNN